MMAVTVIADSCQDMKTRQRDGPSL